MATSDGTKTERRSYFDSNICRLCSFAKDKVLPIFDTSGSKFDAKIKECLPNVQVAPSDGKPQQICLECITKLNIYYEFLCLCVRSDSYFDSYIRAFKLKEQQSLLNELSGDWRASTADHQQSDGLIVLSKIDQPLSESIQDLVVVVELKYKDGAQEVATKPDIVPEYEGLQAPVGCPNVMEVSNKNLEQAASIGRGNSSGGEQDSATLRGQHADKLYFRFDDVMKEYECALCDRKFKRRSRLSSHLTRHTGVRPHVCGKCDKSFDGISTFTRGSTRGILFARSAIKPSPPIPNSRDTRGCTRERSRSSAVIVAKILVIKGTWITTFASILEPNLFHALCVTKHSQCSLTWSNTSMSIKSQLRFTVQFAAKHFAGAPTTESI